MQTKKATMISNKVKDKKTSANIRKHYDSLYAKQNRQRMLDSYHKIIGRDCYGCQKGGE